MCAKRSGKNESFEEKKIKTDLQKLVTDNIDKVVKYCDKVVSNQKHLWNEVQDYAISAAMSGNEKLYRERDKLKLERDKLQAERDQLREERDELAMKKKRAEQQNDRLYRFWQTDIRKLRKEMDSLREERDDLKHWMEEYQEQKDRMEEKLETLLGKEKNATRRYKELKKEYDALKKRRKVVPKERKPGSEGVVRAQEFSVPQIQKDENSLPPPLPETTDDQIERLQIAEASGEEFQVVVTGFNWSGW